MIVPFLRSGSGELLRPLRWICLVLWGVSAAAGGAVLGADPAVEQKPGDLKSLTAQLAAPSYLRREIASRQLVAAGEAAVAPLEQAIRGGDLEVVERASSILQDLATLESPGDTSAAWDALSRLEQTGPAAAASRAEAAKSLVRTERGERARARLEVAGLSIGLQEMTIGSQPHLMRHAVRFPANWSSDEETLRWLPWIYEAETAVFEPGSASPDVLAAVGRMPNIREIQIREGQLDAAAIRSLAELKRIDVLELVFVDYGGEPADSAALTALPLRHHLILTGTDFAEADIEKLREQLPGLEITYSRGGFLGVVATQFMTECRIQQVLPGSAADRAGLQSQDVIIKFGDQEISQFSDLQQAVRKYTPEDQLQVTILRHGQQLELPIQLGRQ